MSNSPRLGFSGWIAKAFQNNPLTPILAIAGLLLGLVAVLITPREEEPQIDVTMANVFVPFPGASSRDVENMVAFPYEQMLSEVEGVKHVYSISRPGMAIFTVEFVVGVPRQEAIVRLYNQVYSNADWAPANLGVGQPLVRPMGIDDVPVMSVTLWTDDPQRGAVELAQTAHMLEAELKRVPGTRDIYTIGAPDRAVLVEVDATRLAEYGFTLQDMSQSLLAANLVRQAGERVISQQAIPVTIGSFLADREQIAGVIIGMHKGMPVYLSDVAKISDAADSPIRYAWHGAPIGSAERPKAGIAPAVTLAIAKKPGANAADITTAISERLQALKGRVIPEGIKVSITRDYGKTATDKAEKLIHKLAFVTMSVVLLVLFALGWREAIVVGAAVIVTLALTLFASWAMGFTLNRVSLFALIFSIGILVDDAIVVVENIHRHMQVGGKKLLDAIPPAVDEVGGPTILATFAVIAALMPMAFVSGLMGPYMRPIPINASVGMLLSLGVALIVTPWLSYKLLAKHLEKHADASELAHSTETNTRTARIFQRVMSPFLFGEKAGRHRRNLLVGILIALALSASLAAVKLVVLKMLPFDNKSEFQVVVDLPEGRTLEDTQRVLIELAGELENVPEVLDYQGYAGTSAPVNFNGLVRQYYLRSGANVGDLQVNLVDKHERDRASHDIAAALRPKLNAIGERLGASIKVVEVPPGPPVLAPLVAEIYGPDYAKSRLIASDLETRFRKTPGIVDIDTTVEADSPRDIISIDRDRAARLGISQASISEAITAGLSGNNVTYLRDDASKYPVPIRLRLPAGDQASLASLLAIRVRADSGKLVPISELVNTKQATWDGSIYHKDLLPVVYVTGDESSKIDSPLYGMFNVVGQVSDNKIAGFSIRQFFFKQPIDTGLFAIKWDGEWQITFETFRDMGLAYSAGLVLIYLLVLGQFRSYLVPLIIMAPIPLTVIGVMPGHALLGAQFTATSMIGMIALAGIIVRNSILLVDFIQQAVEQGMALEKAVIDACAVRAQPILLTGVAAMLGAFFILDDPIFNGLAVSLIFGILVSTVLTLVVIPLLYYVVLKRARDKAVSRA
jgi:multidrug efflux pump subunit AcrB